MRCLGGGEASPALLRTERLWQAQGFPFTFLPSNTMITFLILAACSIFASNEPQIVARPPVHDPASFLGEDGKYYADATVNGVVVKLPAPHDLWEYCAMNPIFIETTENGVTTGNWQFDCGTRTNWASLSSERDNTDLAPFLWAEHNDGEIFYVVKFAIVNGEAIPVSK